MSGLRTCALCKQTRTLRKSHYIPAGVYRILQSEGQPPIRLNDEGSYQDNLQIYDFLLCDECEERFNNGGERWFLQNAARTNGFRLASLLDSASAEKVSPRIHLYRAVEIAGVDIAALAYFALSLFWRAAVHTWKLKKKEYKRIHLGRFQENLRTFLLGETSLSDDFVLWVSIPDKTTPISGLTLMPHGGREGACHRYRLLVLGVMFDLFVGRKIPLYVRYGCFLNEVGNPILRTDMFEETVLKGLKRRADKNPNFFKEIKKRSR